MTNFKITLSLVTSEYTSEEQESYVSTLEDAIEEANDIAFTSVGFSLDYWKVVDFGDGNRLYSYTPNEIDTSRRYKISILKEED